MAGIIVTMPLMDAGGLMKLIAWAKVGLMESPSAEDDAEALIGDIEQLMFEANAQPGEEVCLRRCW